MMNTDQQAITEHLATKVMDIAMTDEAERASCGLPPFDPFNNAEDSRWILSCFFSWDINYRLGVYECVINGQEEWSGMAEGDDGDLHAICIAAARATGYEGEL